MKFTVPDLKRIGEAVRALRDSQRARLAGALHRRQVEFCQMIDEVGLDPRCTAAHQFCTCFCALALRQAEQVTQRRLPSYQAATIQEVVGLIRRGEESRIGRRACGYRERIRRHALKHREFDEDDTAWLCTIISAFLFLIERSDQNRSPVGRTAE